MTQETRKSAWPCSVSQRIIEFLQAFPDLILAMAIAMALGSGTGTVIIAIAITRIPFGGRVIRSVVLSLKEMSFVEAARSLGMHFPATIWKIILPPALKIAIPPHTSNAVAIAKDTSLASVVAMPDLLKEATDAQALTANPSPLIAAAVLYLIVLVPAVRLATFLERRVSRGERR